MRKKHTFLLTIVPAEDQPQPALGGRLEFISTGDSFTFTNMQELQQLIMKEIQQGVNKPLTGSTIREEKASYTLKPPTYPELRKEDY